MADSWNIFPATMGEDQAWITYNHGYADIAEEDPRNAFVRIRAAFRVKTESGMPANEESPALDAVDDSLNEKIGGLGGVYVGRVTVGTIGSSRKARELGGAYDGRETSVERQ